MATSTEILANLSRHAELFEFPVLDNVNAHFIAGRLRGFKRQSDWGLLFELLVHAPLERQIVTDVYAYGPLAGPEGWALFQVGGLVEVKETPLWDDDGNWISVPSVRVVLIGGELVRVSTTSSSNSQVELPATAFADEIAFTKALVDRVGFGRFVPENVAFDHVPGFAVAQRVISITDWDHPDIAGEESPLDSKAIIAAAELLASETDRFNYDHYGDNLSSDRWRQ